MNNLPSTVATLSIALILGGCFTPTFPEGILCTEDRKCPGNQVCADDDRCYSDGPPIGSDAAPVEVQLSALEVDIGTLVPDFDPTVTSYAISLGLGAQALTVTPTASASNATIRVGNTTVESGTVAPGRALLYGSNVVEIEVTALGGVTATYSIDANRGLSMQQRTYAKASNAEFRDYFGTVALDGDTIAVGATGEASAAAGVGGNQASNTSDGSGAIYILVKDDQTWSQQAYIKASNPDTFDRFGSAIALSGDTLVVGANAEASNAIGINGNQLDDTATNAGAVYVFVRVGSTWAQQAYLKASNTGEGDQFGRKLALSGDTLVVGASSEDSNATGINGNQANNGATGSGAAYIFVRNGTTWTQQAYLKSSDSTAGDNFGGSVAIDEDTIAIGAGSKNSSTGAAYVFTRNGTIWTERASLRASNAEAGDRFETVSVSGDVLVVGASFEASALAGNQQDNSANRAGAAYVFGRSGNSWTQEAYLKASNPDQGDFFGNSISVNSNGALIGASYEASLSPGINGNQQDNSIVGAGAAYLFARGTEWEQIAYIKPSNPDGGRPGSIGDYFGASIALGESGLVIGAALESSSSSGIDGNQASNAAADSGAIYFFE